MNWCRNDTVCSQLPHAAPDYNTALTLELWFVFDIGFLFATRRLVPDGIAFLAPPFASDSSRIAAACGQKAMPTPRYRPRQRAHLRCKTQPGASAQPLSRVAAAPWR